MGGRKLIIFLFFLGLCKRASVLPKYLVSSFHILDLPMVAFNTNPELLQGGDGLTSQCTLAFQQAAERRECRALGASFTTSPIYMHILFLIVSS